MIGQEVFRDTLLEESVRAYWYLPAGTPHSDLANCTSAEELPNVFNGFLFETRIDWMFGKEFISFEDDWSNSFLFRD